MPWDYFRELMDFTGMEGIPFSDGQAGRIRAIFNRLDRGQQRRAATEAIAWLRHDSKAHAAIVDAIENQWPRRLPIGEEVPDPDPDARWWRTIDAMGPDWLLRERAHESEEADRRSAEQWREAGYSNGGEE
jgi:hypothetical protein